HIAYGDTRGLLQMSLLFLGILLLTGVLQYIFVFTTNMLGQDVIRDLRVKVFSHIVDLRLAYFDKTAIGTSSTRTINDIETINTVFSEGAITIIADLLTMLAVLIVMFMTSVKLTLICLVTMPLMLLATYIFKQKVKKSYQTVRAQIQRMNAFLQEHITGMRIVQIFNAERQERDKFRLINREYARANLDAILYYAVFFPVVEVIMAIALGLMVWWGARSVLSDEVTLGALIAFPIYLNMLYRPMRVLADKFNTVQMGLVAGERVFAILDDNRKASNPGILQPARLRGAVSFQHVYFSYDGTTEVLHDVSFDIPAGGTLAIVGSTGSGKTTIINILNRFYEIKSGSVLIDGIDIREYELSSLRERVAMVLQDVFLFTGTVYENITLMRPDISREQVIEASRVIGAHPFIERLPAGYDFVVTERGNNLSMGQRQLISFVRALVYNPDILILDEATSSIDNETEAIIQHAIETLIAQRTSIVIAHRLSTIRNADNILVLDHGVVKEFGPHEELLKIENGLYKKLHEMQFAHALEA
ncbi:MAG TPA: ABC transporter ATP-binding protein, partial [Saprospiraceae bacterium]|nr:ABC transporter ATP-binding protein [Saprospiraceae bacterium]